MTASGAFTNPRSRRSATCCRGLGTNFGPTAAALEGIETLLATVHRRHGRTVTLIGHGNAWTSKPRPR
jgi:hypothetical protein